MKPLWKEAPVWAQWLAQDSHGAWGWYEHKPVIFPGECGVWDIEDVDHSWERAGYDQKDNHEWHETLEMREE